MNEKQTIIEGLRAIANGLPTHTAAKIAKDLLGRLDTALSPVMAAPKMLDYAFDMPAPWEPVPVTATGQRMYRHPDGRLACGIPSDVYGEFFNTRFMPLAHSLVHAGGFLYIEANTEEDLINKVTSFDENYRELQAERSAPPTVRRIGRRRAA